MLFALGLYLFFGAIAGVLAGLLGIGGGIIIVPMLNYAFRLEGLPDEHMQLMAVATSMACIVFTSLASLRSHHHLGGVDWPAWKGITPGILLGTFGGTWIAVLIPGRFLKGFFVCFLIFVGTQMLLNFKPKPTRQLPGTAGLFGAGGVIGFISSLVGIGGGTMTVPFLTMCNVPFRTCIGTSAAVAMPIALAGTLGYIVNGWHTQGLPAYTFGFIYLPACVCIVAASTLSARFGAKLAHKLPIAKLKRIFACFILVVAAEMLRELL